MKALDASCGCGAVTFTATPKDMTSGACHCSKCRKWAGGIFLSADCGTDVLNLDAEKCVIWNSSDWAERVSCQTCGASLIWRMKDGSSNQVSIQAFDDPDQFTLDHEVFTDMKPAGYDFAGDTKKYTQADVMAMFANQPEASQ